MKVLLFSANFRFPLRFLQYGCEPGQNLPICVCVTFDCADSELCWINLDPQLVQSRVIGLVANGSMFDNHEVTQGSKMCCRGLGDA